MVSIKFSKTVSAARIAQATQSVPTAAALLAFALFFISIFAFAGCTARAALSLDADKGAALSFKTEAGKSLEQTVTAFTGTEENKTLFDDAKIKAAKRFLHFAATDEVWAGKLVAATGAFPATSKIKIDSQDNEILYNSVLQRFFGQYYNNIAGFSKMRTYWNQALKDALAGENVQNVLDRFTADANTSLTE